jgi:prepilin-type N-terminal cleavage/methylation domain-containing protein
MVRRRAFTLIEVLTVLIVLTLTMGVGFASVRAATESAYTQIADGTVATVYASEFAFYNEYGVYTAYPTDLAGVPNAITLGADTAVTSSTQYSIAVGATTGDLAIAYLNGHGNCTLALYAPPVVTQTASVTTTTVPLVSAGTACVPALALTTETPLTLVTGGSAK